MSMAHPPIEAIAASAACTVSAGTRAAADPGLVMKALRLGRQLATFNRAVPLPVLLDAAAQTGGRLHSGSLRADRLVAQADDEYKNWLAALRRAARGLFEHADFLTRLHGQEDLPGFVPLLSRAWPMSLNGEAQHHDSAYKRLLESPAVVSAAWRQPRSAVPAHWHWWPKPKPKVGELRLSLLHALYLPREEQRLGQFVHHFDHGAGQFYLDSRNAWLLDDQTRRILNLRRRKPRSQSWPHTQSYEELDPRFGVPSLAALVGDTIEQVCYDLLTKPRISNPPPFRPPETVQVHLGWMIAESSPVARVEVDPVWKWFEKRAENSVAVEPGSFFHSGLLQGLAALVVDDWRHFFDPLPVDFFLHRESPRIASMVKPDPNRTFSGTTGARWKDLIDGNSDCLPPAATVTLLFDTIAREDIYLAPDADKPQAPLPMSDRAEDSGAAAGSWWCLFVCRDDLPHIGFIEQPGTGRWLCRSDSAAWSPGLSPYTHIVILDPSRHLRAAAMPDGAPHSSDLQPDGTLCRICAGGGGVDLIPLQRRAVRRDFAFSTLRIHLVDVLLEQLERLM